MPRPIVIVRWLIALYAVAMAILLLGTISFNVAVYGSTSSPKPAPPDAIGREWAVFLLLIWLVCVIVTGWRAMDFDARRPDQ
jgi:hypothetical protein